MGLVALSCPTLCDPMDCSLPRPLSMEILQARILEWVAILLQGIFPTEGSNPGLPHCWQILYQLSHRRSPRILEWVAYPFSSRSSWPRDRTRISCIEGRFFTSWTAGKTTISLKQFSYSVVSYLLCASAHTKPQLQSILSHASINILMHCLYSISILLVHKWWILFFC